MDIEQKISEIEKTLKKTLPGFDAQIKMAPSYRSQLLNNKVNNIAGVMLLLYPVNNIMTFVLMKRADYPGVHSGQISLPGGKADKADYSILETATRETYEEIGVPEKKIQILGNLTPLIIPVSNFIVHPYVGYTNKQPKFQIDIKEVSYLIEVEVEKIIDPSIIKTEIRKFDNFEGTIPYFEIGKEKVWGATAMILSEFIEIWKNS